MFVHAIKFSITVCVIKEEKVRIETGLIAFALNSEETLVIPDCEWPQHPGRYRQGRIGIVLEYNLIMEFPGVFEHEIYSVSFRRPAGTVLNTEDYSVIP